MEKKIIPKGFFCRKLGELTLVIVAIVLPGATN